MWKCVIIKVMFGLLDGIKFVCARLTACRSIRQGEDQAKCNRERRARFYSVHADIMKNTRKTIRKRNTLGLAQAWLKDRAIIKCARNSWKLHHSCVNVAQ